MLFDKAINAFEISTLYFQLLTSKDDVLFIINKRANDVRFYLINFGLLCIYRIIQETVKKRDISFLFQINMISGKISLNCDQKIYLLTIPLVF